MSIFSTKECHLVFLIYGKNVICFSLYGKNVIVFHYIARMSLFFITLQECHLCCFFPSSEADYVYAKQKKFIPLKMQEKYTPDGWLGALIGAKLYIEFSGKYNYQVKYQELETTLSREVSRLEMDSVSTCVRKKIPIHETKFKISKFPMFCLWL